MPGAIYLAMGPSGAGKDTLLLGARSALASAGDETVTFIKRNITRAADSTTDIETSVTAESFEAAEAAGEHALSWAAHETRYAIPAATLDAALASGKRCLLNVSRTTVEAARAYGKARDADVYALYITCGEAELKRRLLARGREDEAAVDARLARSRGKDMVPSGEHVLTVMNEGGVEVGVDFVRRLLLGEPEAIAQARGNTKKAAADGAP